MHDLLISVSQVNPFGLFPGTSPLPFLASLSYVVRRQMTCQVAWVKPTSPQLKVNVNSSALGSPGHSEGGFIVRNSEGRVVAARSIYLHIGSSFRAELLALLHALDFCHQQGFTNLSFELDSMLVVDLLRSPSLSWRFHSEFSRARHLVLLLGCSIRYVYRVANVVVDCLAKLASTQRLSSTFAFCDLPPYVRGLLALDTAEYPYLRARLQ